MQCVLLGLGHLSREVVHVPRVLVQVVPLEYENHKGNRVRHQCVDRFQPHAPPHPTSTKVSESSKTQKTEFSVLLRVRRHL